ncbi:MAG: HEPN domain-containing protein [Paludibacteraceae bacterium]|nr:HEPN domain-containing protein [Paludibacteraceae bacterium]
MDKVKYWLDLADYDYATAGDLMTSKRWLYVAFMCHQTLEKTIKAYYTGCLSDTPPYIHNLTRLAELSGLYAQMTNEQRMFLDAITPLNIEARYPDYKSLLASSLNHDVCARLMRQTYEMQSWIKSKL